MRLTKEEEGAVMMGITASVVMRRLVDCRQGEVRSIRLEASSLLGDGLLDSSVTVVLERRASSMVNLHDKEVSSGSVDTADSYFNLMFFIDGFIFLDWNL